MRTITACGRAYLRCCLKYTRTHAYDYGLWLCVPTQLLWNTLNRTYDVAALFGAQAVKIGGFLRAGEG